MSPKLSCSLLETSRAPLRTSKGLLAHLGCRVHCLASLKSLSFYLLVTHKTYQNIFMCFGYMDTCSTTVCGFSNSTSLGSLGMLNEHIEKCGFVRLLHTVQLGFFLALEHFGIFGHLYEPSSGTSTCCQRACGHFLLLLLCLFCVTDSARILSLETFSKCPCGACRNSWVPLQLL